VNRLVALMAMHDGRSMISLLIADLKPGVFDAPLRGCGA
jgi:hypothetical protein